MLYRTILIVFLVLTISLLSAQEGKTDAVYLELTKEYTLEKDGSWSYHYSHKLLINTYYAFHNLYGEDFIIYDPAHQKLKINRSVTTMADGKQVASPENAYNELLPGFATNVPAWNRLREMVVTHTALERGASVDFDYTLTSAKGYIPVFMANEQLLMNSPVKKMTVIVSIPSGVSLHIEQFNIQVKPEIVKSGGKTTYTWKLTDMPAAMREDFKPREQQNRPRIVFAESIKKSNAIAVFASQEAFKCEVPADVKAKTANAVQGIEKPLIKALKLQEIVCNEFNTWLVPLANTGFKLRNPVATWQSNGGTEGEKAVLLTAMLRSQNIQAEPVAVAAERYFSGKAASPALFERFLVKVNIPGMDPVFLSPVQTDQQDLRYTLTGKRIISMVPGKVQASELIGEANNVLSLSGNLEPDTTLNFKGNLNLELGGRLNPWLKMQKDTAYAASMLSNAIGSGKISDIVKGKTDIDISSYGFKVSNGSFGSEKGNHMFVKIPSSPLASDSWHMTELLSNRTEPLEIPFAVNEAYDIFITIPDGMVLVSATGTVNMKNEFGSINCSISVEGNQLHIVRNISIIKTYVPVEKYNGFREMVNTWNSKKYREVVFKKN